MSVISPYVRERARERGTHNSQVNDGMPELIKASGVRHQGGVVTGFHQGRCPGLVPDTQTFTSSRFDVVRCENEGTMVSR